MRTLRPVWGLVLALATLQFGLSEVVAARAGERAITYVFTPMVDVVPGGVPLSAGEASELAADARNQVDARDIQKAYAWLGSTISLNDLLEGVEGLEASGSLSAGQRGKVRAVLDGARADHAAVYAVQEEILGLEAELGGEVEAVLAALPAETRARVEARATAGKRPGGAGAPGTGVAPGGVGAPGTGVAPGGVGAPGAQPPATGPRPGGPAPTPGAPPGAPGGPGAANPTPGVGPAPTPAPAPGSAP